MRSFYSEMSADPLSGGVNPDVVFVSLAPLRPMVVAREVDTFWLPQ